MFDLKQLGLKNIFIRVITSPITIALTVFIFISLQIFNLSINIADEGFFLYSAKQILLGQIPYRDFFMQVTPGNYYLLALFVKIFGNYIVVDRIMAIIATSLLLILLSKIFNLSKRWQLFYLLIVVLLQLGVSSFFSYNVAFIIAVFAFYLLHQGLNKASFKYLVFSGIVSALAFIFKQNVGLIIFLSFPLLILLLAKNGSKAKSIFLYLLSYAATIGLFVFYFLVNNALPQMIYYTIFFAGSFKGAQIAFLLHRIIFLPVFLVLFFLWTRFDQRKKIFFLIFVFALIALYLGIQPARIGRLIDYLKDPVFYVQTLIYTTVLVVFGSYIGKKRRSLEDKNCLMYAAFVLDLFLIITAQGYDFGVIGTVDIFLLPLVIIFLRKYHYRRLIVLGVILLISTNYFYHPFSTYALSIGKYPLHSFSEYSSIPSARYLKFNSSQNRELTKVVKYVDINTSKNGLILCFPYCPMLYILADRQGASYYGIFGLANEEKKVLGELKVERPKIIVTIKQGDYILTPSLSINNFKIIYSYININYRSQFKTANFEVYTLK
jgi:hypothetical protein